MTEAHKRETEKLKRCLRSAARWILTHDIYKNMGQEILDEAKELLGDNGEFLQPKDGQSNEETNYAVQSNVC